MLVAHDTFTYLPAKDWLVNLFSMLWRCQVKSPQELYKDYGVNYFDLRLCKSTHSGLLGLVEKVFPKKPFKWGVAHGLAEFDLEFNTVYEAMCWMHEQFPKAKFRIILERCSKKEVEEFRDQIENLIPMYQEEVEATGCQWIGIKLPWECLWRSKLYPQDTQDYCCRLFNWTPTKDFWYNMKHLKLSWVIKKWARLHNPMISKAEIDDPQRIIYMDYIGVYPTPID